MGQSGVKWGQRRDKKDFVGAHKYKNVTTSYYRLKTQGFASSQPRRQNKFLQGQKTIKNANSHYKCKSLFFCLSCFPQAGSNLTKTKHSYSSASCREGMRQIWQMLVASRTVNLLGAHILHNESKMRTYVK